MFKLFTEWMNCIAFSWSFRKLHTKMISAEIRTAYSCHGMTFKNANVSKKSTQSESPSKGQWVHFCWTSTRWEGLTNKKDDLTWSAHMNKLHLSWTHRSAKTIYSPKSHNTSLSWKHVILTYEWDQIYSLESYILTLLLKLLCKL